MNDSTAVAVALVAALRRAGVTDVVLAPGSRSAALALALHEADGQGMLRLHVRVDERAASFLALGLALRSGRPVPVCTTSGTAADARPPIMASRSASRMVRTRPRRSETTAQPICATP